MVREIELGAVNPAAKEGRVLLSGKAICVSKNIGAPGTGCVAD